jgi:hypothetical protein
VAIFQGSADGEPFDRSKANFAWAMIILARGECTQLFAIGRDFSSTDIFLFLIFFIISTAVTRGLIRTVDASNDAV